MRVKGFPEDAVIKYVGNVFKYDVGKNWYINLGLQHKHIFGFYYIRFSNMPALTRNRCLNPKNNAFQVSGYPFKFKISSTSTWSISCSRKNKQYSFTFNSDDISGCHKNTLIHLPQIELARVLFFHNAYLARSSLDLGCLAREFDVQRKSNDFALINALPSCNYPIRQFDHSGMRRFLAWMLLDPDARRSYESIALSQMKSGFNAEASRRWNFNFEPPLLNGVTFEAYGNFNSRSNELNIYEITAIHDLTTDLPKTVHFYHNKFRKKEDGGKGSDYSDQPPPSPPEINDEEDGGLEKPIIIDIPKVSLSFKLAIETRKVALKSSKGSSRGNSEEPSEYEYIEETGVSTGESSLAGTIPSGEFEGIQDESDDLELYLSRFSAFSEMIDQFFDKNKIAGSFNIHKLPYIERCSKHLTADGNARHIAEVCFEYAGQSFVVLEVDTSDNLKPLSTKVFRLKSRVDWAKRLNAIRFLVVKKSLRWPVTKCDDLILETWQINHPRSDSETQHMSSEEINRWADRLGSTILL